MNRQCTEVLDIVGLKPSNRATITGTDPVLPTRFRLAETDEYERHIVALQGEKALITLEPGGQLELSGEVCDSVHCANAEFSRHIDEIVTVCDGDDLATSCGGCRQKIREFAHAATVIHAAGHDGVRATYTMAELLPDSFGPENLGVDSPSQS